MSELYADIFLISKGETSVWKPITKLYAACLN